MNLGVMGGTFDPVHIAHLVAAEEALYRYGLREVVFVLSARPPHKMVESGSTSRDRFRMLELALEGNESLSVSGIEMEREGLSYTVDTLRELKSAYGHGTEIFFIAGADAVLEIMTWKDPEVLLAECTFIVAARPEFPLDKLKESLPEKNSRGEPAMDSVRIMETPKLEISSTDIRERAGSGRPFRYMVPDKVWAYIMERGLYQP